MNGAFSDFFRSKNEEETRIRCLIWMAATALIGHDFKPGFWLSFAALLPERAAI